MKGDRGKSAEPYVADLEAQEVRQAVEQPRIREGAAIDSDEPQLLDQTLDDGFGSTIVGRHEDRDQG